MRLIWSAFALVLFSGGLLALPLAARADDPGATIPGTETTTTLGEGVPGPQTTDLTVTPPANPKAKRKAKRRTPKAAAQLGPAEEAKEIFRLAVDLMSQKVATYNTKVRQVDAADAQYRKDFGQYARAQAGLANLLAGHPGDRAYGDLIADRDASSAAAKQDLIDLHDAAQVATEDRAPLKSSPLWSIAFHEEAPCGAAVDLTRFAAELKWGDAVDPSLKFVEAVPPDTSKSGSAANEQLAATLKPRVLQELDAAVTDYNGLLQDATYEKSAAATASKTASKKTAPPPPRVTRNRRGQIISVRSSGATAAQTAAKTAAADKQQMNQDLADAARFYRWLIGFPAIMGSTYRTSKSSFPELPFVERL